MILACAIAVARAYAAEHQMVVVDCLEELNFDSNADKRIFFPMETTTAKSADKFRD